MTIHEQLRQLPFSPQHLSLLSRQRTVFLRTRSDYIATQIARDKRRALHKTIQQLRSAGYNITQIAVRLGRHRETVRKYYTATYFPERKQRRSEDSLLDHYLPYLEQRFQAGCENAMQLWRELQQQGYPGSPRQVSKWMQLHRSHPAPSTPKSRSISTPSEAYPQRLLPSSKQIAWLWVRDPAHLTHEEAAVVEHLQQDEGANRVYGLAQQFVSMVKQRLVEQLDPWLAACDTLIKAVQIRNFALGLRQDYAAVRAALETSWSNGQTEG